jgi:hypothetical protein
MLETTTRMKVIGLWFSLVAAVVVSGALLGVPMTTATAVLLVITCIAPPAVMLMVWRGGPPPTVAETLNAVDRRP